MTAAETAALFIAHGGEWIRLGLEAVGSATIAVGAMVTIVQLARASRARTHVSFTAARLTLARYLALALEFQLAADLIETAIAPDWQKLGQLAAIAAIRTVLNYFLSREMSEERAAVGGT